MTDTENWTTTAQEDLWLFDKLILARRLGYVCGPAGVSVPDAGVYIVRPITNLDGMGRGASFQYLGPNTQLEPGYFWCEIFTGQHLSVDYEYGVPVLSVEGTRDHNAQLWRWSRWQATTERHPIPFPELAKFPKLNIEFINGHAIEVHLRHNPNFEYNNTVAVPVWDDEVVDTARNFVSSPCYRRKGFYVND